MQSKLLQAHNNVLMHPDILLARMSSMQGTYGEFRDYFMYQTPVIQSLH